MAESGVGGAARYVAFISYSHRDAAIGRWLHRRLETYRIPRRLAGSEGEHGPVPARLTPIFRDRDELPAAGDLSERVRAALAVSDDLIVVCSPNAAASPWVAREIETFRALHPDRPVFAAIVEGEPGQCFPPALSAGGRIEPLAADLRKEGDGRRLGVLKLVAGLAGVGLDALVQRDAQRNLRRVTMVTLGAVAAMLVMAVLTILALSARAEAERQRAEAEGLVEFMLTDLRDRLKGVGRLDVMTAVNTRALHYYGARRDIDRLGDDSLARRARIMQTMGEDHLSRHDQEGAFAAYGEALATTSRLVARDPNDPRRLLVHTTSLAGMGQVQASKKEWDEARRHYSEFETVANRLLAMSPSNPDYLMKAASAAVNLGNIKVKAKDNAAAEGYYEDAVSLFERAWPARRNDPHMVMAYAKALAWLADSYFMRCEWEKARATRVQEYSILSPTHGKDPENRDLSFHLAVARRGAGLAVHKLGKRDAARTHLVAAETLTARLIRTDPANADWQTLSGKLAKDFLTLDVGLPPGTSREQLRRRYDQAIEKDLLPASVHLPPCFASNDGGTAAKDREPDD